MASTIASPDVVQPVIVEVPISGGPPPALHRGECDLPFVPYQEGVTFQLIQVDIEAGFLWFGCAANRAGPSSGTSIPARSLPSPRQGRRIPEYSKVNMAGSSLRASRIGSYVALP